MKIELTEEEVEIIRKYLKRCNPDESDIDIVYKLVGKMTHYLNEA